MALGSVLEIARRDAGAGSRIKVVVNPGSVGQPLDCGLWASDAVIEGGVPEIRRVKDEIEATAAEIRKRELAGDASARLIAILKTGAPRAAPA